MKKILILTMLTLAAGSTFAADLGSVEARESVSTNVASEEASVTVKGN
jgi:hypothetical protein